MEKKYLALSFDDGPDPFTTPFVLDVLEEFGVRASFFLIGEKVCDKTASLIQRQLSLGCTVECHSWSHLYMGKLESCKIEEEVTRTDSAITKYTGRCPEFFRPPYIDLSPLLFDCVKKPFICGSDCQDWVNEVSCEERVKMILDSAKNGQIFLLHDSQGVTETVQKTVQALKIAIPILKERGFDFVTVPEIFRLLNVNPFVKGKIWSNVLDL